MVERETLGEGKFLRLVKEGRWEFVERLKANGVVGIVAVTGVGKLILTAQYRPALGCNVIALPAGLSGDDAGAENEPLMAAAARELREETGYKAERLEYLFTGPSSSGLTSETVALFKAHNVKKVGAGGGDATENIIVHEVALKEIDAWLTRKGAEGSMIDPKIYTGLYFLKK